MTEPDLRDVFACCALIGLAAQSLTPDHKAKMAYEIADSMLEKREETEGGIASIKRYGERK